MITLEITTNTGWLCAEETSQLSVDRIVVNSKTNSTLTDDPDIHILQGRGEIPQFKLLFHHL